MTQRGHYDDKFRASAVVMLKAAGYPDNKYKLQEIADHLRVPSRTLRRWFNGENGAPPDDVVQQVKKDLAERLEELAHKLIDAALDNLQDTDASLQQINTSLGIVLDKRQLLIGKPTEIVDDASLTDDERAARIATILDKGRARRAGSTDSEADDAGGG